MSNRIRDNLPTRDNWLPILLGMLSMAGLYAISRRNFLLFHCLAESFSIVIAIAVFAIFWNTRRFLESGIYLIIGFGCLFAGLFDLIYIFAYQGMSVFPGADGNIALQGKTVAQWYVSLSCACAITFVRRTINQNLALAVYSALSALALGAIFYWRVFPDCYVEGVGQTPFERMGLAISCSAYLGTLVLLVRKRREFDSYVLKLLAAILIVLFVEDLASALATDLNGFAKAIAHLCQVVALFLVYKAFVEVGLTKPYDLLLRTQQQTAEALERQRQFLEAVLESTADGILVVDLQGRIMECNQRFAEMWQMPADLIVAGRDRDLLTSDREKLVMSSILGQLKDPAGFLAKVDDLYTKPEASSFDVLEFKDGRTFERYSQPQRIAVRPVGRVWSFRDVSGRQRTERALRESELKYRTLFETMSQGVFYRGSDGRLLDANDAALKIFGLTREEFLRENPDDRFRRLIREDGSPLSVAEHPSVVAMRTGKPVQNAVAGVYNQRTQGCVWMIINAIPEFRQGETTPYRVVVILHDITERKQAEDKIRESEQRLKNVINAPLVAVGIGDATGRITEVNDAFAQLLGFSREELLSGAVTWRDLTPPEYAYLDDRSMEELEHSGKFGPYEKVKLRKDGTRVPILVAAARLPGTGAEHVAFLVDITDRKRAEEKVLASEASLLEAQKIACLGSYVVDIPQGCWTGSDVLRQIFDIPPDYATTVEGWGNLVHPDERQAMLDYFQNDVLGKHKPFDREYRIVRYGDKQVRWVHGLGRLEFDAAGHPLVMVGTIQDITDHKRAEEALRASEERYRLFVETIPQLAWRMSPDGLKIDCNQRWYEYTGQTPAQVCGHGWLAAVHPDDLFRVAEHGLHAMHAKEPYELEYRLRRALDATYRWHLARGVPVLDTAGQVTCWIESNTDIEELKQAQEILKQAHDEQLQRHRAELAHVARLSTMGEMAASLAHELNQPLHAVKNYAYGSICRMEKMPERDEEIFVALEQISEETTRAAEIIRRIKGFVQKRELRFSEMAVNGLIEEAVLLSKADLGRYHAKIALELAEGLPTVIGDAIQIEQVIMNLVRNGLEAMEETPDDNRLLGIRTLRQGENAIQVDVRDCGKGIGEESLKKAFEPFFTTKPEGMGMGLAISRSIVQAHRGRIWATVNELQGCTFHFTLPVAKGD